MVGMETTKFGVDGRHPTLQLVSAQVFSEGLLDAVRILNGFWKQPGCMQNGKGILDAV
jgi:hypothetical protein